MVSLNFALPLRITRSYLYLLTILSISAFVLLPWSIIAYLKFYQILIPATSYQFLTPDINYIHNKPFIVVDCNQFQTKLDPSIDYDFDFYLKYDYNSLNLKKFNSVNYRILIISNQLFQLKIMPKLVAFHNNKLPKSQEWDLTTDLPIDSSLISSQQTFKLSTSSSSSSSSSTYLGIGELLKPDDIVLFKYGQIYIRDKPLYVSKKWFDWGGNRDDSIQSHQTISHSISSSSSSSILHLLSDEKIDHLSNYKIIVEFNNKNFMVEELQFKSTQVLQNLRFVVYHYYYLSFLVGVSIFWAISFGVSLMIGTMILQKFAENVEKQNASKIKREHHRNVSNSGGDGVGSGINRSRNTNESYVNHTNNNNNTRNNRLINEHMLMNLNELTRV